MSTVITCPHCKNKFNLEDVITEDVEKSLKSQYEQKFQQSLKALQLEKDSLLLQQQDFEEKKKRENKLFAERLEKELSRQAEEQKEQIRRSVTGDFENKLKLLEDQNREQDEKLKIARRSELDFLQQKKELQTRAEELELSVQRKLQEERSKLSAEIRALEEQKTMARETAYQMRMKELEKQLEDQKKLAEEMKRKAEQGSMQLQGEVQELLLENILQESFPFDQISEVGKGVKGADCIQTVRNRFGQECGRIIYESKRTKDFSESWIEKLKTDMRSRGADVAVIVTQAMPRDLKQFGEKNGVWVCSFSEVVALAHVIRDGILKIHQVTLSQENKGDKMQMLYQYLTGNEFSEQWKAIREGFSSMKQSIQREREAMERLWKAREKQLEKVLLNAAHIRGSIEGIAGNDAISFNLIEDTDAPLLDE